MSFDQRGVLIAAALGVVACAACAAHTVERRIVPPEQAATLDQKSPFLKAHLRTGYVYVFATWHWVDSTGRLSGSGTLFDTERRRVADGHFDLPRDSVALFETNVVHASAGTISLAVMMGVTVAVGIACLSNPKACFGSCPTFYAPDSTGKPLLQAEGFSASIAPGLEATDVDALYRTRLTSRDLTLTLTNEAFETHVIRYADVLAAARPPNGRVFAATDGVFYQATELTSASGCHAADGDCRSAVAAFDGWERFTPSDSNDLGAREIIDLEFERPPAGQLGLIIAARQSLMTTFLIYQALAYMGTDAAHWLATISPSSQASPAQASAAEDMMGRLLGRIDVLVPDSAGGWRLAGSTGETGPIATDTKIIPLSPAESPSTPFRVRLRLTKGLWRIDWVSLAALGRQLTPHRIQPRAVRRDTTIDAAALDHLTSHHDPLVTLPGDVLYLDYRLPANPQTLDLFIETRGYYLEWMRREWMAEQSSTALGRLLLDPAGMLRTLAPAYKRQEASMEALFWGSRYVKR